MYGRDFLLKNDRQVLFTVVSLSAVEVLVAASHCGRMATWLTGERQEGKGEGGVRGEVSQCYAILTVSCKFLSTEREWDL